MVHGLSSCVAQASLAVVHRLSCSTVGGILVPKPRVEPEYPALQGRFLTPGPPESPYSKSLNQVV